MRLTPRTVKIVHQGVKDGHYVVTVQPTRWLYVRAICSRTFARSLIRALLSIRVRLVRGS